MLLSTVRSTMAPLAALAPLAPAAGSCAAESQFLSRRATAPSVVTGSPTVSLSFPHISIPLRAKPAASAGRHRRLRAVKSVKAEGPGEAGVSQHGDTEDIAQGSMQPLPFFPWQSTTGPFLPSPASNPPLLPLLNDIPMRQLSAGPPLEFPASRLLSVSDPLATPLLPLSRSEAQGIILRAAMGTGWTTQTGLQGPSLSPDFPSPTRASGPSSAASGTDMLPLEGNVDPGATGLSSTGSRRSWPELTSSPRRTSRVRFTCNRCGERTVRAINPHAYEEGTVFVQCGGCLVFHKLVDNLNLFHELQGHVFQGSDAGHRGFGVHESVDVLGLEDPLPPLPFN